MGDSFPVIMKYKFHNPDYAPILKCTLPDIGDTKLGNVNLPNFWKSMENKDKTLTAQRLLDSGLAHAAGYPTSVQCPELVLERMKAFNPETKEIRTAKGNVVVKLDPISIAIVFRLPFRDQFIEVDKEYAYSYFVNNEAQCLNNIARKWLAKPRRGKTRLPKIIHKSLLMEDIANMVILLNRVMGNEDSNDLKG